MWNLLTMQMCNMLRWAAHTKITASIFSIAVAAGSTAWDKKYVQNVYTCTCMHVCMEVKVFF